MQDVFTQLWLRPGAWNPQRGSLPTFVTILTRSRAVDRYRARGRRSAATERSCRETRSLAPPVAESAAEPVLRRERARGLRRALDRLPGDQRSALLAYGDGFTVPEIARAAGVPLGTAKSRVRLALLKAHADAGLSALVGETM